MNNNSRITDKTGNSTTRTTRITVGTIPLRNLGNNTTRFTVTRYHRFDERPPRLIRPNLDLRNNSRNVRTVTKNGLNFERANSHLGFPRHNLITLNGNMRTGNNYSHGPHARHPRRPPLRPGPLLRPLYLFNAFSIVRINTNTGPLRRLPDPITGKRHPIRGPTMLTLNVLRT